MKRAVSAAVVVWMWASACTPDADPPEAAGSSSSTTEASSSGLPVPDVAAGDSTGNGGWPLPTDDDVLTCVRSCEGPWDCCPPETAGLCPGVAYPYNYMCIEGVCVSPPCTADADCPGDGEQCLLVGGGPRCVLPCTDDIPCQAADSTLTCSAVTDEGAGYCFAHCDNSGVFCGNQTCDSRSGLCLCTGEGQCQSSWLCL